MLENVLYILIIRTRCICLLGENDVSIDNIKVLGFPVKPKKSL